jgi:parallel beta-helix repeat protein
MRRIILISTLISALSGCGEDIIDPPAGCEGPNGPCIEIAPGPDVQQEAQTALIEAQPGDIILFLEGVHEFTRDLSLDVDGVTIRGQGMDRTMLVFAGQTEGAQGMLVTADDFTIEDLAIEDTVGDGLKVEGATGVYIRRVRVEWTAGPSPDNGAYGLYPVQCTDVLIEDSVVMGASDAGVYVGQSSSIIVRRNQARHNVAGIEIENSSYADVHDNVATENTGGLLIFNLPGLQVKNGARTRAFDNQIYNNNTENFAPPGNIVSMVPRGTGVAIMAGHQVELFGNEIRDNLTANVGIISYLITQTPYDDPAYDPYSDTIYIHDNTFGPGGGEDPAGVLGALITVALRTILDDPIVVPDIVFDGFVNPDKAQADDTRLFVPEYNLCFEQNGDADFANLDMANNYEAVNLDASVHACSHTRLPAVTIAGAGE